MPWLLNINWDDIMARFKARFPNTQRTKQEILCVVEVGNDDIRAPYIKAYVEIIRKE